MNSPRAETGVTRTGRKESEWGERLTVKAVEREAKKKARIAGRIIRERNRR